jgi:hypothetical protein
MIPADVVRLAEDVIESRNIGVVGRAIIVDGLRSGQGFEVADKIAGNVAV